MPLPLCVPLPLHLLTRHHKSPPRPCVCLTLSVSVYSPGSVSVCLCTHSVCLCLCLCVCVLTRHHKSPADEASDQETPLLSYVCRCGLTLHVLLRRRMFEKRVAELWRRQCDINTPEGIDLDMVRVLHHRYS